MDGKLRSVFKHFVEIFWIYLRFMVLAVIIFFLVQWYITNYGDDEPTTAPTASKQDYNQQPAPKQDL